MKHSLLLILAAFLLLATAPRLMAIAEDEPPPLAPKMKVTGSVGYYTSYVGSSNGAVFYDGPVLQSSLALALESGIFFGLWHSTGLDNSNLNGGWDDELDYYLGWSGPFKGFDLLVSASYFDDFDIFRGTENDVWYGQMSLGKNLQISEKFNLTPYARYQIYVEGDGSSFTGGQMFGIGADSCLKLTKRVSIPAGFIAYWDDGTFGLEPGIICSAKVGIQYELSKHMSLTLGAIGYSPVCVEKGDSREQELVGYLSIGFSY